MNKKTIHILVNILVLVVILLLGRMAYGFAHEVFDQEPMTSQLTARDVTITVEEDMSVRDVARLMKKDGLIKSVNVFCVQERFSDFHGKISPGTHVLNTALTADEMLHILAQEEEEED